MHELSLQSLLVPSVTIHLYNDQYTVRLSGLTETTVSTLYNHHHHSLDSPVITTE